MTNETKILAGFGILTVILVIGGAILLGNSSSSQSSQEPTQKADSNILIRPNSTQISTSSAKATLVEFADFQCPACATAHPTVKQILKENKGKVNFVYRHFPLPQHKNARISAQAAEAAGIQGKFWEMYDKLYENQSSWSESNSALDIFTDYAKDLELDIDQFKKDIENNELADKIQKDANDGNTLGVNSTPTFFLNNQKVENLANFGDLKTQVESEIKNK